MKQPLLAIVTATLLLPAAAIAAVALPIVRTTEPATPQHRANGLSLAFDNWSPPSNAKENFLIFDTVYPDLTLVRGRLNASAPEIDPKAFRISARPLARPGAVQRLDCYQPTPDRTCIVVIELEPGDLASGLEVTVTGDGALQSRSFTHVFRFAPRTSYSSLWWDALMGV